MRIQIASQRQTDVYLDEEITCFMLFHNLLDNCSGSPLVNELLSPPLRAKMCGIFFSVYVMDFVLFRKSIFFARIKPRQIFPQRYDSSGGFVPMALLAEGDLGRV